ncbi:MAG: hypothetical protein ABIP35_08995, partial [Ginsengibacter sp.]
MNKTITPFLAFLILVAAGCNTGQSAPDKATKDSSTVKTDGEKKGEVYEKKPIDTAKYNQLLNAMANNDTT